MTAMPPRIGPYEIVRPLGAGGFGRTFEARHVVLGERACLKLAHPGPGAADRDLALREAKVLWGLHHPCLPNIYEVLVDPVDGGLVLAMRFVEGRTLAELTPIDVPLSVRVAGQVLRALRVLDRCGIVHGDVKPANVIVEPDRRGVVLVDLGLASVRPGPTTRAPGWTEGFVAPEVRAGRPPLPESDLFSLGLTLAHALGGDVERRVLPAGVPDPLIDFIVALTRRDPRERPCWGRLDPLQWLDRIVRDLREPRGRRLHHVQLGR